MYRSVLEYKIGVGQDILRSVNGSDHVVGRQAGVPVEMERPGWGSIMRPALQQAGFSAFGKSRRPRSRVSKTGTWTDAYPSRAAVESKPEAFSLQAKKCERPFFALRGLIRAFTAKAPSARRFNVAALAASSVHHGISGLMSQITDRGDFKS